MLLVDKPEASSGVYLHRAAIFTAYGVIRRVQRGTPQPGADPAFASICRPVKPHFLKHRGKLPLWLEPLCFGGAFLK